MNKYLNKNTKEGKKESLIELKGKIEKEKEEEKYIYIMCSTLNQMVNYIPLKMFSDKDDKLLFSKILNLTITESKFSNELWDENLKISLKEGNLINDIKVTQKEVLDVGVLKNKLTPYLKDNVKVFWNITGGQRTFVLAVTDLIKNRPDDILFYLEGNNNKMVIIQKLNYNKSNIYDYELNDITIDKALKLAGFKYNEKDEKGNKSKKSSQDIGDYKKLYDDYFEQKDNNSVNEKLRDCLIMSNKRKNENNIDFTEESKTKLFVDNLKNDFNVNQDSFENIKQILKENIKFNFETPFGYILEKIVFAKINDFLKNNSEINNKIAEIKHSYKLNHDDSNIHSSYIDDYAIDEFDIVILTKHGKLIVFECKSGGMEGDVAKSTKYSTYAVSGVYGLPILITPLLEKEIESLDNLGNTYKSIKSAIRSAKRANLKVWGIDKIEENLKKLLEK